LSKLRPLATIAVIWLGTLAASSCDTRPPTGTDIRRGFDSTKASYVELRSMIMQDLSPRQYATVGIDLIDGYWRGADGKWSMQGSTDMPVDDMPRALPEVLARSNISQERYSRYLRLLNSAHAERVSAFSTDGLGERVEFLVNGSRFVTHGCSTDIYWQPKSKPEVPGWAKRHVLTDLAPDWYALSVCN
jgi:hypothetical protein